MSVLPRTLADLKRSAWAEPPLKGRSVRDEIRANLLRRLEAGGALFPGIVGYEDTIVPQLTNALLARHHFILLGLRGQAKTRLLRMLTGLLDDLIPVVEGSEINDDPFAPVSKYARERLEECGDATSIGWLPRGQRYVEKLATPDVTIADLIGDLDPIRAARGGHVLADELTMHFGLLPRANRGIFAVNELPDLSGKVQVGLFNIMQEGDVQIKGYPVRLQLDVLLAFTANPEDYTARGKIITPLKDRIGSEITTHYPLAVIGHPGDGGRQRPQPVTVEVAQVGDRFGGALRGDDVVVAVRRPPDAREGEESLGQRILLHERPVVVRISDIYASVPSITGKLELEYEGELQGGGVIARDLIRRAAGATLAERVDDRAMDGIVAWFDQGGALKMSGDQKTDLCLKGFGVVPELLTLIRQRKLADVNDPGELVAACELVLEGLAAHKRISRNEEGSYGRLRRVDTRQ